MSGARGRLQVLFITPWYPTPEQPGAAAFVREHARAVQLYDEVAVLHYQGIRRELAGWWRIEEEADPAIAAGIPTFRLAHRASPLAHTSYPLYLWSLERALAQLAARGFRPDVIHAHVHDVALASVLLGRRRGLPVFVTEHSSAWPRRQLAPAALCAARLGFRWADRVLPVSRFLQTAIEGCGVHARFTVTPNTVDTALFHPGAAGQRRSGAGRLLFVGRLDHLKGLHVLFDALDRLPAPGRPWTLDIVGDGPDRAVLEGRARAAGFAGQVRFHGAQTRAAVAELMRAAELFILPSLQDNLPCVVIEALASGLPVLSTTAGGIPELVDGAAGVLVPPGDAGALCAALAALLAAPGAFDRPAIAARAQQYDLRTVGGLLDHIYRNPRDG